MDNYHQSNHELIIRFGSNSNSESLQRSIDQRCGYVAILGLPNAGKSTLLNACLDLKLVGVSRKPQTTRRSILGISNHDHAQIIFIDTPGIIRENNTKTNLDKFYLNQTYSVLKDADSVVYLIDGSIWLNKEDHKIANLITTCIYYLNSIVTKINVSNESKVKILVVISKCDRLNKYQLIQAQQSISIALEQYLDKICQKRSFLSLKKRLIQASDKFPYVHPISSKISKDVDYFKQIVINNLPYNQFYFDRDQVSDKSDNYIVSEIIKEFVFRSMGDEIPYHTGVMTKLSANRGIVEKTHIDVFSTIIVSKKSHKGMIIGKQGAKINALRKYSRKKIEDYLGCKINLKLWVKVQTSWSKDPKTLEELL